MKEIKELRLSNNPNIHSRSVLLNDDKDKIKDKSRKQFITCNSAKLTVTLTPDDTKLVLHAPKGYKFDGATIPFNIGKTYYERIELKFSDISTEFCFNGVLLYC